MPVVFLVLELESKVSHEATYILSLDSASSCQFSPVRTKSVNYAKTPVGLEPSFLESGLQEFLLIYKILDMYYLDCVRFLCLSFLLSFVAWLSIFECLLLSLY